MRIELVGGAYAARSNIASATRAINYYPERNPQGVAVAPWTHYQTPGMIPLVSPAAPAPGRQVYRASNGDGYCCIGQDVYYISPAWVLTKLGTLQTAGNNPVYFIDNGEEILLVDGSPQGYQINMATRVFAQINDPFFTGGVRCDTIDGFILWNVPGTRQFKSTLDNQILPFDNTYVASKAGYPDPLQGLIINRRQILLIGQLKSEVWYDVGGAQFPFAEIPGTYIEHGAASPYSIASADISTYWLGQDLQGVGYVFRQRGYETQVVSNYALSEQIRQMAKAGTISDAIGFTYTQGGHAFYYLVFPTGNQTWVYDDSIGDPEYAWHQRCWTDANGNLNRARENCGAWLYGQNVSMDWQNGTIYSLDLDTYTDTVGATVYAKSFIRTFPHLAIQQIDMPQIEAMGRQVNFTNFALDIQSGKGSGGPPDANGVPTPDQIWLSYSTDRGVTWLKQPLLQSNGTPGQYITQPKWSTQGNARDMLFEIGHSINGPVALNAAWVTATPTGN